MIPKFRIWDGGRMIYDPSVGFIEGKYTYRISDIFNEHAPEPMQSTGLTDKNHQEMYEGDIVYCGINKAKAVVKYNDKIGQYRFYFFSGERQDLKNSSKYHGTSLESWFLPFGNSVDIEIIGNIHKNPELMNK